MTTTNSRRGRRRWLLLSGAFVVLAALAAWWAGGSVAAFVLEAQLREAGWLQADVAGGSLVYRTAGGRRRVLPDVVFDRVTLTGDTLVAENVRARLGRGVEHIGVGRLRVGATMMRDGALRLPGAPASRGGGPPLDLVPRDGITLDRAEIEVETPFSGVDVDLSQVMIDKTSDGVRLTGAYASSDANGAPIDFAVAGRVSVEMDYGGGWNMLLQADDGRVASGSAQVAGLEASLTAAGSAAGDAPSFGLESAAGNVRWGEVDLGALAVTAAYMGGSGELQVASRDASVADIAIDARIAPADDARTLNFTGRVALADSAAQGLVSFNAALVMPLDARSPRTMLDAVRGRVDLRATDAAVPGLFSQGAIEASADITGEPGALNITFGSVTAQVAPAESLVPQTIVADGTPLAVSLGPAADAPPSLRIALAERAAQFAGRVEAHAGDVRIGTALRAEFSPRHGGSGGVDDGSSRVAAEVSSFAAENLPWNDVTIDIGAFAGTIEYTTGRWQVDGAGRVDAQGELASVRFTGLRAEWAGTITGTDEQVRIHVRECLAWDVDELDIAGVHFAGLSPPCMKRGDGGPLLSRDSSSGRSVFAFALEGRPLAATVTRGGQAWPVDGSWPELEVDAVLHVDGVERLSARFAGGALTSVPHALSAEGVSGTLEWRNGVLAPSTLRVERFQSLGSPAWFAPVELELDASAEGGRIAFDASASDPLGTFVVDASGRHGPTDTSAEIKLYPVRFVPGATEVADLSPRLADTITGAAGLVELEGRIERNVEEDRLRSDVTLTLDGLSATVLGVPIEGLRSAVRFTSLLPFATAPGQSATIERVDLGMPLEDGRLSFALEREGRVAIDQLDFAFAGGRLFAEPFTIDSVTADDIGFVLRAEDVELAEFLASSRIEGLAGSGTLSGRVPVRLSERAIRLDEGVLAAETDGVLRYTPDNLPDFLRGDDLRSRMLREVLTNFHYEELSLAVSGESAEGGQQRLTLSARGANPDFLEGHPIELAFNFTGPLLGAVRSAVDLSGAAELEQRFDQRDTDNEENSR